MKTNCSLGRNRKIISAARSGNDWEYFTVSDFVSSENSRIVIFLKTYQKMGVMTINSLKNFKYTFLGKI